MAAVGKKKNILKKDFCYKNNADNEKKIVSPRLRKINILSAHTALNVSWVTLHGALESRSL